MTKLEQDYSKVAKEINAKIKEAAKAMKAANKIAKKAGLEILTTSPRWVCEENSEEEIEALEEKVGAIDFYPLFEELQIAGWSTSSMSC